MFKENNKELPVIFKDMRLECKAQETTVIVDCIELRTEATYCRSMMTYNTGNENFMIQMMPSEKKRSRIDNPRNQKQCRQIRTFYVWRALPQMKPETKILASVNKDLFLLSAGYLFARP